MFHGYAEPQRTHFAWLVDDPLNRLEQLRHPPVVAAVEVAELLARVAPATPADRREVGAVGDAEVLERHQEALVYRLPEAQLNRGPAAEPVGDVAPVETLRRGGQAEQLARLQPLEEPLVACRGGVMELVDDKDVEGVGIEPLDSLGRERLDHREDVLALGDPAAAVDLAEGAVAQHRAVGRQRLSQDLLAVGDEEEREAPARRLAEGAVVERGDHGLAGPRRRDDEVAVAVVAVALDHQGVEHPLLVRVGPHIEVGEVDRGCGSDRAPIVFAQGARQLVAVALGVVGDEVLGLPVAGERHPDPVDHVAGVDG